MNLLAVEFGQMTWSYMRLHENVFALRWHKSFLQYAITTKFDIRHFNNYVAAMSFPDRNKTIEIFSGTVWEAEMIRSLLNDAHISNFTKNNVLNVFMYEPIQSEGVKIIILEQDKAEAQKIIDHYFNNLNI